MTEIMLRDAGAAHGLDYVILRISTSPVPTPPCASGNPLKARPTT